MATLGWLKASGRVRDGAPSLYLPSPLYSLFEITAADNPPRVGASRFIHERIWAYHIQSCGLLSNRAQQRYPYASCRADTLIIRPIVLKPRMPYIGEQFSAAIESDDDHSRLLPSCISEGSGARWLASGLDCDPS
jgi:hypothetical protein